MNAQLVEFTRSGKDSKAGGITPKLQPTSSHKTIKQHNKVHVLHSESGKCHRTPGSPAWGDKHTITHVQPICRRHENAGIV